MNNPTTIQLDKSVVKSLKQIREYPRQTYNELISHMIELFKHVKQRNQYDEFLHKIQQQKMKELWDNKEDEAWEDA
jgi:rRNA pseudouridine-1189 N-methylase Emg1 (Nep1/Mra1 family)